MEVSEVVRREVGRRFPTERVAAIVQELMETELPLLDRANRWRDRDRVHLAILKLAAGDVERFESALKVAAQDWRDVLLAAGLGNADWPQVLERAGFPVI